MLGTEYNWLIESSAAPNGSLKVRLTSNVLFTLGVAVFCFICVALQAAAPTSLPAARDVIILDTPVN